MMLNDLIILWNHASIHMIDVRQHTLQPRPQPYTYLLPTSVFLLSIRGHAQVQADHIEYTIHGVHAFHGGKGLTIDFWVTDCEFECVMFYYKAVIPLPCRPELAKLMERGNPFLLPYAHAPNEPVPLLTIADKLVDAWNEVTAPNDLRQYQSKILLHQFVCELFRQMHIHQGDHQKPHFVDQAKNYITEHFAESLTLESITTALNYSIPYLSKQFKLHTGLSPIDFLIRVRLEKAKEWLLRTDLTVNEVASGVGYTDFSYFIRAFKKYTGFTPGQYKEQVHRKTRGSDNPMTWIRSVLVPSWYPQYNNVVIENGSQLEQGEKEQMMSQGIKWKLPMLMLGLALLLSACSGTTQGVGNTNGSTTTASSRLTADSAKAQWPRIYKDGMGRDVKIASQPERIIVTHFGMMEYFFALDTPPVASTLADRMLTSFETLKPYSDRNVKDIGEVTTPNLEMMTTLNPDIIVAFAGTHNDVLEDLSKISPVVMINNEGWDWSETLRQYAQLAGKEELAEQYITKLTTLMQDAQKKLAAMKDKTVTFLRPTGDGDNFYVLDESSVGYVYDQEKGLGMKSPGKYKLDGDIVSLEGVTLLDPDYIFIIEHVEDFDNVVGEMNKSNVWKSLKAVKNNHVFPLDVSISTQGPLAIEHTTTQLLHFLVSE